VGSELRNHWNLNNPNEYLPMTTRRMTPIALATAIFTSLTVGCIGPGFSDKDPGIVGDLKIEIPKTATSFLPETNSVAFLMPNDQWRDYVAKYYPDKQLSQSPASKETDGGVPPMCIPAFRSGTKLTSWTTGAKIQYRNTDKYAVRGVVVTPDCEPGKAYVQWSLSNPK
jgi:hypothetical protein